MHYGIVDGKIPTHLPYSSVIQAASDAAGFSACLAYAVVWRETIRGQVDGSWNAAQIVSGDGGHGLYQLTSSWPDDWIIPKANVEYALSHFLLPGFWFFGGKGMRDEALIKCIAAGFNEGDLTAWDDHTEYGNVDIGTANHDYSEDVLRQYNSLIEGKDPH